VVPRLGPISGFFTAAGAAAASSARTTREGRTEETPARIDMAQTMRQQARKVQRSQKRQKGYLIIFFSHEEKSTDGIE